MMKLTARFLSARRGSTALEFALMATPVMMLALGGIEFGRIEWTRQALHETAIAGARCMGIGLPECTVSGAYNSAGTIAFMRNIGNGYGLTLRPADFSLNNNVNCQGLSGFSRVQITYQLQTALPEAIVALSTELPVQATACFPNQPVS